MTRTCASCGHDAANSGLVSAEDMLVALEVLRVQLESIEAISIVSAALTRAHTAALRGGVKVDLAKVRQRAVDPKDPVTSEYVSA